MDQVKVLSHAFLSTLIAGTLWRMITYHFLASPSVNMQHLGHAMTVQY
jgi:hypothetical protein